MAATSRLHGGQAGGGPVADGAGGAAGGGGWFGYGLDERLDVAVGKGSAAVAPGGVLKRLRHVVVDEEAVEANVVVDLHGFEHVDVASVDELLAEAGHCAVDVAEVDVQDLVA